MVASPGMNFSTVTATIANNESLSGAVNLGDTKGATIFMPAAWTAASLTFQVSHDGTNWFNLYDKDGTEYTVQADASRAIVLPLADWFGVEHLKIRSGTAAAAVNQGAERILTIQRVF